MIFSRLFDAARAAMNAPALDRIYRRATTGPPAVQYRYGTARGMARLWLSRIQHLRGSYASFERVRWDGVQRLVFVCRGNICRSPYAERRASQIGMPATSFGLRAVEGAPADPEAARAAARHGVDLGGHRARTGEWYRPERYDLLLAMEPEQAHCLAARYCSDHGVQVTLLGLWCRPRRPHIYDPKDLSPAYFDTMCRVIDDAISGIRAALPASCDL